MHNIDRTLTDMGSEMEAEWELEMDEYDEEYEEEYEDEFESGVFDEEEEYMLAAELLSTSDN